MLPLESILRNYTMSYEFSEQCLAQGRRLADSGFVASGKAWAKMNELIEEATPDDALTEIKEWWEDAASAYVADKINADLTGHWRTVSDQGWGTNSDFEPVLKDLGKVFSLPRRTVLMRLKAAGIKRLVGSASDRKRGLIFREWWKNEK